MIWLVLGIVVWSAAHVFKRAAPAGRKRLGLRAGPGAARGIFAALILVGLLLMIFGYRAAAYVPVYVPPEWGIHLNNPLMLVAVYLFGASGSKNVRVKRWLQNPMLAGVICWSVAHLLVNGDVASILMFGAMGLWAVSEIILIDRADRFQPVAQVATRNEVRLIVITLVAFAAIIVIHTWLGYWPLPRG